MTGPVVRRSTSAGSKTHQNWADVLDAILIFGGVAGGLSLAELRKRTAEVKGQGRLAGSTLRLWLSDLQDLDLVEFSDGSYRLGSRCGLVLGLSVGSESVRGGLFDANGVMTAASQREALHNQLNEPPERVLSQILDIARELVDGLTPMQFSNILGIAVALPAPVDRDGFISAVCDASWRRAPFVEFLEKGIVASRDPEGRPLLPPGFIADVINDANADVLNLAFDQARLQPDDASKFKRSMVLMTIRLSGGVGAGLLKLGAFDPHLGFAFSRSRMIVGSRGLAGEIGHVPVDFPPNAEAGGLPESAYRPCSCGSPTARHLEGYVSARAVMARLHDSGLASIDLERPWGRQLEALKPDQHEAVREALRETGKLLGRSVAGSIRLMDPSMVQLTGTLGLQEVKRGMDLESERWDKGLRNDVSVSVGGNEYTAARGAALMIFRRHVYRTLRVVAQRAATLTRRATS